MKSAIPIITSRIVLSFSLAAMTLVACDDDGGSSDSSAVAPGQDRGSPDAGGPDQDTPDQDTPDQETPDAGGPDQETPDAGGPDQETPDAGTPDQETPDAGTPDQETPDAGTPDQETPDAGGHDCPPPTQAACGNGVVDADETCDIAIAAGADGACLTACDDGDACTADVLVGSGTCSAACSQTRITSAVNGDGCCPAGATAATDDDCAPVMIVPTAFRVTEMQIRDPHIVYDVNCGDINSVANILLNQSITQDRTVPLDGSLDLNVLTVFRPLDPSAATSALDVDLGAVCSLPDTSTMCRGTGMQVVSSTATNQATGTCLATLPGTTFSGYSPAVSNVSGPCFVSDSESLAVSLGSVTINLQDARVSGTYVGSPATQIDGLIRGFVSRASAQATVFPADLLLVGGKNLAQLLTGGTNTCTRADGGTDLDVGPDGTTQGWYFYISFTARPVPYTSP